MNKIALITGATSGIGEGCARRFARGGYNLILTGRNTGKLEILKKELEAEGVEVLALAFDVRNREAAKKAVDYIPEEWRRRQSDAEPRQLHRLLQRRYASVRQP